MDRCGPMVGVPQGNKKINMSQRVMNSILCTICMRKGSQGLKNKKELSLRMHKK